VTTAVAKEVRHLFTAAQAARLFAIPAGSIRAWKAKKVLWHQGLDEHGNPMYDKDDLLALRDGRHRRVQRQPRTRRRKLDQ